MRFDPDKHHRRSIRLSGYEYGQAGAYFVTICAHQRACLFGGVVDGEMRLNQAGRMVEQWWAELTNTFPLVTTDEHVVMPNHLHGVVIIVGTAHDHMERTSSPDVGAAPCGRPDLTPPPHLTSRHPHRDSPTLGTIMIGSKP